MISLLHALFPYIVLFYLIDCFIFLKPFQWAFSSLIRSHFRLSRSGLNLVGFLPFNRLFLVSCFPVFYTEKGIYIWKEAQFAPFDLFLLENFNFTPYEKLNRIHQVDGNIILNDSISFDLNYSSLAFSMVSHIRKLIPKTSSLRSILIKKKMDDQHNIDAIEAITKQHRSVFMCLEILGAFIFCLLFILIPLHLYFLIPLYLEGALLLIFAAYFAILMISVRHIKKNKAYEGTFFMTALSLVLSPVTSMRMIQTLTRYQLLTFDSVAVAAVMFSPSAFRSLLQKEILRLHFSILKCSDGSLKKCMIHQVTRLKSLLSKAGISSEDEIFKASVRKDAWAESYCPFCHVEFVDGPQECPDCQITLSFYD